jgi:hypothetical protein
MNIIPYSTAPLAARRQLIAAIVKSFTAFPRARSSAKHPSSEREPANATNLTPASILVYPIAR